MPLIHVIESFDDPRLAPYRNMKEKDLARDGHRFIAEGEQVVRRLLASPLDVESVLVAHRKHAVAETFIRSNVPLLCASDEIIERVIGFAFHSGVLACGIRPRSLSVAQLAAAQPPRSVLMVCQEIANTDNMGSLIRIAAAMGAAGIVLGELCCDPYFRQSVRVSMGTIFAMPIVRSANLLDDLHQLADLGYERWAALLADDAQPLQRSSRPARVAVVFGNEAQGLDAKTISACDRRIMIPMHNGTDSLNVAVAAAVFLYELSKGD